MTERKDSTVAKNLMGKRRDPAEPYLTVYDTRTGSRHQVLKSYQADETKPQARWLVQADLNIGFRPSIGDSYVADLFGGSGFPERPIPNSGGRYIIEQFDPAVIEQVRPVLEEAGIEV